MQVISTKYGLNTKFAGGSMRNAMSRYTGVGTFNKVMPKGKVLTYPVEDFRKLLKFTKEENIWWRDQVAADFDYELLSDVGLDFNQEKMYQVVLSSEALMNSLQVTWVMYCTLSF